MRGSSFRLLLMLLVVPSATVGCRASSVQTRAEVAVPREFRILLRPEAASFIERRLAEHREDCLASIYLGGRSVPDVRIRYVKDKSLVCERYYVVGANPVREVLYSVEVGSRAELFENVYRLGSAGYRCWGLTQKLDPFYKCFITTGSTAEFTLYDGPDDLLDNPVQFPPEDELSVRGLPWIHNSRAFASFAEYVSVAVAYLDAACELRARGRPEE
jgi:hypothetical protein